MFFFNNYAKNEAGRLVLDLFLFFEKALYEVQTSGLKLSSNISIAFNFAYDKTKLYKFLDNCSKDILNFKVLEKDLGILSPPNFVYELSRKVFIMLYSIN